MLTPVVVATSFSTRVIAIHTPGGIAVASGAHPKPPAWHSP